MVRHTPGPWFVVEGSDAKCDAVCHDEDAAFPLAYVGTERTLREKHANAKLIAAAPLLADMLEEVTALLSELGDGVEWDARIERCRSAIRAAGRL